MLPNSFANIEEQVEIAHTEELDALADIYMGGDTVVWYDDDGEQHVAVLDTD